MASRTTKTVSSKTESILSQLETDRQSYLLRGETQARRYFSYEPQRGRVSLNLRELWDYRELLYFLVWRDVKVRYKQTILGIGWAVVQPVMTMVVFSVFFGYLGKIPSDNVPYPIFAYSALLPWQLFAYALSSSSNSLVLNQSLVTKVYFPRLLVPLATVIVGLVDFFISFVVLLGIMYYYGYYPTPAMLFLPLLLLLTLVTSFAVGLWLSALNVIYRDVQYTIPFLTQFWLFITPIAYSSSLVPEKWRTLYALNPMVGVIEGFRWAILSEGAAPDRSILLSLLVVVILFVGGIAYFRQMENSFADTI